MRCPACNTNNSASAQFCVQCGEKVGRARERRRSSSSSPWLWALAGALVASAILVALQDRSTSVTTVPTQAAVVPAFDESTLAVASHFVCTCGRCGEKELADCTCPRAIEEKTWIASRLGAGVTVDQVLGEMASRYGGKKS